MGDVIALTTTSTGSDITTLSADIATILGQYSAVQPTLNGLVAQLEHINATVMELNVPMVVCRGVHRGTKMLMSAHDHALAAAGARP